MHLEFRSAPPKGGASAWRMTSGQSAVKGNQIGYKIGIRINIDVLNAEQQLYNLAAIHPQHQISEHALSLPPLALGLGISWLWAPRESVVGLVLELLMTFASARTYRNERRHLPAML